MAAGCIVKIDAQAALSLRRSMSSSPPIYLMQPAMLDNWMPIHLLALVTASVCQRSGKWLPMTVGLRQESYGNV